MVFTQEPDHHRYIIKTLMVGHKNDGPANGQILLIGEFYGIAQRVVSVYQEEIKRINRPFMRAVTKCIKAYPLYGMKNEQCQSK